jgi:hypothetical protein
VDLASNALRVIEGRRSDPQPGVADVDWIRFWIESLLLPVDSETSPTDVTHLGLNMFLFALGILMFAALMILCVWFQHVSSALWLYAWVHILR